MNKDKLESEHWSQPSSTSEWSHVPDWLALHRLRRRLFRHRWSAILKQNHISLHKTINQPSGNVYLLFISGRSRPLGHRSTRHCRFATGSIFGTRIWRVCERAPFFSQTRDSTSKIVVSVGINTNIVCRPTEIFVLTVKNQALARRNLATIYQLTMLRLRFSL